MGIYLRSQKGFTLMEVLLAVALLSIVSASAISVFSMGLQIWKRARQSSGLERKALLALEKISTDLRSAIRVKGPSQDFTISEARIFDYKGKSNEIMIPVVFSTVEKGQLGGYGRKTYRWDSGKKEICRSVENIANLFRESKVPCEPIATNVTKLRFQYRLPSGLSGSFSWYDQWEIKSGMPLGVDIEMEFTPNDPAAPKKVFHRTVAIPVGAEKSEP